MDKVNEMLLRKASHAAEAALDLKVDLSLRLKSNPPFEEKASAVLQMAENLMRDSDRLEMALEELLREEPEIAGGKAAESEVG